MEVYKSFLLWKTLISECNIPSKTESKEGVGEKSEENKARKMPTKEGV
jgi:hypothetical protein